MDRLNTIEAANFLGVAYESLKRSRWSGDLLGVPAPRFVKVGSRNVQYLRTTLEGWLRQHQEFPNTAEVLRQSAPESVTPAD